MKITITLLFALFMSHSLLAQDGEIALLSHDFDLVPGEYEGMWNRTFAPDEQCFLDVISEDAATEPSITAFHPYYKTSSQDLVEIGLPTDKFFHMTYFYSLKEKKIGDLFDALGIDFDEEKGTYDREDYTLRAARITADFVEEGFDWGGTAFYNIVLKIDNQNNRLVEYYIVKKSNSILGERHKVEVLTSCKNMQP